MTAGRELDALVSEKVMGWIKVACLNGGNLPTGEPDDDWNRDARADPAHGHTGIPQVHRESVPEYSADIAAAWLVVEKLGALGYTVTMDHNLDYSAHVELWTPEGRDQKKSVEVLGESMPEVICLAAIQALTHAPDEGG